MLSHRLSPFEALHLGRSSPRRVAVACPPKALPAALVTPAARRGRITRTRLCGPDTKKSHAQLEQGASTTHGDRAVLLPGLHGQLLNVREAMSATLIVLLAKFSSILLA